MEKINKNIRLLFGFALGLSIGFPAGILAIIFGAIRWIIPLLIVGILLTVGGFYAMPILWVSYAERRRDRTILSLILYENIYDIGGLAAQTGLSEKVVLERLNRMIFSRELTGYLLVDGVLELNTNAKQTAKPRETRKCDGCGANMGFDGVKFVCEYCGSVAKKEK